jgi:hypothetical protein
MPDISASLGLLDATVFLYPSVEDAERGKRFGGSGVIVGIPAQPFPASSFIYVVTNWHVACQSGNSVIRISTPDGKTHIIDKDPSEWAFFPGRQDLAATRLYDLSNLKPSSVDTSLFITDDEKSDAHAGDDVFMVGRFIDYDGHETNRPALRFGTISMMDAPVRQPTGFQGRSIIVDMHSRTGFSGSPVYVHRPGGITVITMDTFDNPNLPKLGGPKRSHRKWGIGNDVQVRLLGILWGQFPELWEIRHQRDENLANAALITDGSYVNGFSGMSCVIPATQILELLSHPTLREDRSSWEQKINKFPDSFKKLLEELAKKTENPE